jgi:hypothetical protein
MLTDGADQWLAFSTEEAAWYATRNRASYSHGQMPYIISMEDAKKYGYDVVCLNATLPSSLPTTS